MNNNFIYLRKSRMDLELDTADDVLERHERQLRELAKIKKLHVPEENILKEVVSGEDLRGRPMMLQLLDKIENDEVTNILCIEIERLSRGNSIDQGIITQAIMKHKVVVHTLNKTYNPSNECDEEFFEFGLFMSRREFKTINRRLQRGKYQAFKEGKWINSTPPFGYDKIKLKGEKGFSLVPNSDADTVKLLFELNTNKGMNATEICDYLNSHGYAAPMEKWNPPKVRRILKNEAYIGIIPYKKKTISKEFNNGRIVERAKYHQDYETSKGLHEPIIDEELFLKTQEVIKSRTSAPKVKNGRTLKNPLAGIIVCGICGKTLTMQTYNNAAFLKCLTIHCSTTCSKLELVEARIIQNLKSVLLEQQAFLDNYEAEIIKEKETYTKEINKLERKMQELNKQFDNICEFLEKGIYTSELFEKRYNLITKEKEAVKCQISALQGLEESQEVEVIKKRIPKLELCLEKYHELAPKEKNELLKSIVTKIEYTRDSGSRWSDKENFELKIFI